MDSLVLTPTYLHLHCTSAQSLVNITRWIDWSKKGKYNKTVRKRYLKGKWTKVLIYVVIKSVFSPFYYLRLPWPLRIVLRIIKNYFVVRWAHSKCEDNHCMKDTKSGAPSDAAGRLFHPVIVLEKNRF